MSAPQTPPAPGWYPIGPNGQSSYWDGARWSLPVFHAATRPWKSKGAAYALLIFLGGFGAHRFYLGREVSASIMLILTLAALLIGFLTGGPLAWVAVFALPAVWIWQIVDLFLIPSIADSVNRGGR